MTLTKQPILESVEAKDNGRAMPKVSFGPIDNLATYMPCSFEVSINGVTQLLTGAVFLAGGTALGQVNADQLFTAMSAPGNSGNPEIMFSPGQCVTNTQLTEQRLSLAFAPGANTADTTFRVILTSTGEDLTHYFFNGSDILYANEELTYKGALPGDGSIRASITLSTGAQLLNRLITVGGGPLPLTEIARESTYTNGFFHLESTVAQVSDVEYIEGKVGAGDGKGNIKWLDKKLILDVPDSQTAMKYKFDFHAPFLQEGVTYYTQINYKDLDGKYIEGEIVALGADLEKRTITVDDLFMLSQDGGGNVIIDISQFNMEHIEVRVADVSGNEALVSNFSQDNYGALQLDISGNPSGVYFVNIADREGKMGVGKIFIK